MTELNFREYLETLPVPAAQDWGDRYTPTEAELPLKVQTVISRQDDLTQRQREAPKRFEVLAGLRDYAADHVLLVGKPGSGKSTALRRLLWEEAQKALSEIENGQTNFTIPVLIELRDRRQGSVVNWMQKSLRRVRISAEAIEDLLLNRRFLLLFDGVNEVPSPDVWSALDEFQRDRDFRTNPRIFTTRELGAGSDLGIEKKLEMLPLTESQMRQFIENRLPGRAENLLRQLKDRLRELAETPLLLKILCDVVQESPDGQLPQNRGELFRLEFIRRYEKFKPSHALPISGDSRRFTSELLQHLAFTMTQGDPHTDPCKPTPSWLIISKAKAEKILEDYLTDRVEAPAQNAKAWLEDLLRFKLLVVKDLEHIEFIHQLFQEYYAAEKLLTLLSRLSDRKLKQDYLNYLKWTEAIALILGLLDNESKVLQIVTAALEMNLMLGARMARAAKPKIEKEAINLIFQQDISLLLRIDLLSSTESGHAVNLLCEMLDEKDLYIRRKAALALGKIGDKSAIHTLMKVIYDQAIPNIRETAIEALGMIQDESTIPALIRVLNDTRVQNMRDKLSQAFLNKFSSENARDAELKAMNTGEYSLREKAAKALGKIGGISAESALIQAVSDRDSDVRESVAYALAEIGSKTAIDIAIKTLQDNGNLDRGIIFYDIANLGLEFYLDFLNKGANSSDPNIIVIATKALNLIHNMSIDESVVREFCDELLWNRSRCVYRHTSGEDLTFAVEILQNGPHQHNEAAIQVLRESGIPNMLPILNNLLLQTGNSHIFYVLSSIQARCGFYNYEITQAAIEEGRREKGKGETEGRNITYQIGSVGNLNTGTVDVQGDQVAVKYELQQQDGECSD